MIGICMLLLLATAMAEPITVTVTDTVSNRIFANQIISSATNITLPEKELTFTFLSQNETFEISSKFNATNLTTIDVYAEPFALLDIIDNDLSLALPDAYRYQPKLAYVIDFENGFNEQFTVFFNYSSVAANITDESKLRVFKYGFNTTAPVISAINYSDVVIYTQSQLASGSQMSVYEDSDQIELLASDLSLFVLAEDTQTTTSSGSSGGSSGGGGGGGGGSSGTSNTVTITLSDIGEAASLTTSHTLYVIYNGHSYRLKIVNPSTGSVIVKNLDTAENYFVASGIEQKFDLDGDGKKEMTLELLEGSSSRATLFAKKIGKREIPSISGFLPSTNPTPRDEPQEERETQVILPQEPIVDVNEEDVKGTNILWVLFPLALLLLLVILVIVAFAKRRDSTQSVYQPMPVINQPVIKPEPKVEVVDMPRDRKLEMEKFIYHGLHEGHSRDIIKAALIQKGWPEHEVDHIMESIAFTDDHVEQEDLHKHNDVSVALEPVKRLLAKGFDEEHIRQGLKRKGWESQDIDEIFRRM